MSAQVLSVVGRVRGVHLAESPAAGRYARIRLARDPAYLMDFDDPDRWPGLHGRRVRVFYTEQVGTDGFIYRVVLDVEVKL